MKISVNWLQDFVKLPPPIENIAERLTMAGLEVKKIEPWLNKKDTLFEIEVTSNRPDWLSHLGVAREISAVENLSMQLPEVDKAANRPMPSGWKINIKEAEGCPYYSGVLIEGVTLQPTPDFIRERLEACGIRSIDLIVDITNYVLLETGQPLHAFDADLVTGHEIQVRKAKAGEKLTALDGKPLELKPEDLVIADTERAIALAGVMGGKDTEVSSKTRNFFLESAFFHPRWIRQTSRRYALSSESSYRFERRVDPEGVDLGRDRALWLIQKYAKPRFISAVIRAGRKPAEVNNSIQLSETLVEKVLGTPIKSSQISLVLTKLGLNVTKAGERSWNVRIPSFRPDLARPIDLVEEIARIYGFDKIPETLPERVPLFKPRGGLTKLEEKARYFFTGAGLNETVTFSLISERGLSRDEELKNAVAIVNPQNKELCWMRPMLLPSLLDVIQRNVRAGTPDCFVFEMAHTYAQSAREKSPSEDNVLAFALFGNWKPKTWLDAQRKVTFYDLKGIAEAFLQSCGIRGYRFASRPQSFFHPGISEELKIGDETVAILGEAHSRFRTLWDLDESVYFAQIFLTQLLSHVRWVPVFSELSRYPAIERDMALTVPDSVKTDEIRTEILKFGDGLIHDVRLFDFFRGGRIPKGYKNLGFRITYLSRERTLVSADIQKLHTEIADAVAQKFQATFQ